MPEKTNSAKRCPSVAQTLDRFLERVRDEPEHAAHFAQKIPEEPSDFLERYDWRRDQSFFSRALFLLRHVGRGNCLSARRRKSDFFPLAVRFNAVYTLHRNKVMSP